MITMSCVFITVRYIACLALKQVGIVQFHPQFVYNVAYADLFTSGDRI